MADTQEILIAHNRFGYGLGPDEQPAEDPRGWLTRQLRDYEPSSAALKAAPSAADVLAQIPRKNGSGQAAKRPLNEAHRSWIAARLEAARISPAPFAERLVHFWSNHFAISVDKTLLRAIGGPFEFEAIRPNITGNFFDLLMAAETHPAMLVYLDQLKSMGPDSLIGGRREKKGKRNTGLNENLGREILELHSMGARSGYTQDDVIALAKGLTGYSVGGYPGGVGDADYGQFTFDSRRHEPGPRHFLGKDFAQMGEDQARAMLGYVVRQPATATFIATKLARHFIADDPPQDSVDRLATAFQQSGGDLMPVYAALIADPNVWRPGRAKFKTPWEWAVSACRTAAITPARPQRMQTVFRQAGQDIWRPKSPAGFPDIEAKWLAPDAMMQRADIALTLAEDAPQTLDPRAIGEHAFLRTLAKDSSGAIAAAGDPGQGLALLFMTPEFLWR